MRQKFFMVIVFTFAILLLSDQDTQAAVNPVTYSNPIRVEVSDSNTGLTTNGFYQIKNLTTNEILLLKTGLPINFQKSGAAVLANFGAYSLSSTIGFEVNEVAGVSKYVTFSGKKGAKRNASVTDPDVVSYNNGEAAEYVSTYTNTSNGQTWYLIKAKNGNQLAVLVDQYVELKNAPGLNTAIVNSIKTGYNEFRGSFKYDGSATKPLLINILSMQNYLKGVVPNEMPASWHLNALKTQAIAARSYAYIKNQRSILSKTTSSQVYNGYKSENAQTNKAVDETNELYVKYNNKVIETFFYSTSGGRTASVGDVWNSNQADFPYLVSVEDAYENSPSYSNWTRSFSSRSILNQFGFGSNVQLTDIVPIQTKVYRNTGATTNGEISGITVTTTSGSKTLSGNESFVRKLFPVEGSYGFLPSNWFVIQAKKNFKIQTPNSSIEQFGISGATVQLSNGVTTISTDTVQMNDSNSSITIPSDPPSISLIGKGFGHRIGMSQYGAKGYAEHGWTYTQILTHYFTGTTIGGL
ncbi:SpoIID/LytB domain-containing protein [Neobacillus sp. MM2021_6]|uniref:SpoIID/LytB domain-containing protein n=1 Tax=Bacillaceae TaxID=186817 RepID=UPI00140AD2DC|nr:MULTISPECIES: SpoIID/LytB domain-containing protein [Bacillaceae]MBO0962876.1 SpoIID/LytB domain-containing protein [Neobacillus sp. MM2021_6]NHC19604.1 SpoIID/LytB domain-containing protein [Bacillus sp. MM2020_4]